MKKKFLISFLLLIIILCPILLISCVEKSSPKSNISEITKIYFQGTDENANGSISVGQREEPYKIDGKHNEMYDFSLIVIDFNKQFEGDQIVVNLSVNENSEDLTMYYSPLNHAYMADIGYFLNANDIINVSYQDYSIDFYNVSDNFKVDWEQALDIAIANIDMNSFYQDNEFKGECYLKILTEKDDNLKDLFWVFTVVGENGEVKNIVLSVENGEILAE